MLKDYISQAETTREAVAEHLRISRSYLSLLENGKKQPSLALAVAIERYTKGAVPVSSWIACQAEGDAA